MKCIFALVLLGIAKFGLSEDRYVTGSVTYRERIALSQQAHVRVIIEDVSVEDRAAPIIASSTFESKGKQVPFSFSIKYDSNQVRAGNHYNVRAEISDGNKLIFTSMTANLVRLDGSDAPVQIVLNRAPQTVVQDVKVEDTRWLLYELNGKQDLARGSRDSALTFNPDDRKFGAYAGVNQIGGAYELDGIKLKFGDAYSTKMAGPPELMKQEMAFLDILRRVTKAKVFGHKLVLYAGDTAVAKFKSSNAG